MQFIGLANGMGLEVVAPMAVYAVLEFSWKIRTVKTSPANSIGKYIQAQPERELGDLPEFTGGQPRAARKPARRGGTNSGGTEAAP